MTDPKLAFNVPGKGRWYTDPAGGPDLLSVTNALDTVNKHALVPWAARVTAERALDILPRLIRASRSTDATEQALRELKGHVNVVREQASDRGTRVHRQAEAHILGTPIEPDPEVQPWVDQYIAFVERFGIDIENDVEFAECTVLNRHHGYAGTLDLGVRLPLIPALDGKPPMRDPEGIKRLWIVDTKTKTSRVNEVYAEAAMQQEAYKRAQALLLDNDEEEPMRLHPVAGTAVLNLTPTQNELIPLPWGDRVWDGFLACLRMARYQHYWHDLKDDEAMCPRPFDPTTGHRPKRGAKKAAAKTTTTRGKAA